MSRPRIAKKRPEGQLLRVWKLMKDGKAREPAEIEDATGDNWASASARLRDLRKKQYGEHIVEKEYISFGVFRYRVLVKKGRAA